MKIIIQAGGLGTRMRRLTECKPKVLVPVDNKPILFHIFDEFVGPDDEFIVIGDYKFDVLDNYLTTFAKGRRVILIKSTEKGNVAGIRNAISLVPEGEPILLVWSDILLPPNIKQSLQQECLDDGVLIGTIDSTCSWHFDQGHLIHEKTDKSGVAGVYYFGNKSLLNNLPLSGSFTTWLSQQTFPMKGFSLAGCRDVGTLEAYYKVESLDNRCRPYNQISISDDRVVKIGLTEEARVFIKREIDWYVQANDYQLTNVPRLLNKAPMTLERIHGSNVFRANLNCEQKSDVLKNICHALSSMHEYGIQPADVWDLNQEYFVKTIDRLRSVMSSIPFSECREITINGRICKNVLQNVGLFRRQVYSTLMHTHFAFYHGDCQLTNTLLSGTDVYFIDPRGYFGKTKIYGDVRYDWAKLYYSIVGNFDQFNVKNFSLSFSRDSVQYSIGSGGWEFLESSMFEMVPKNEGTKKEILLIHAIAWLSLASHAWEDYDSMCVAFYNGTYLFNEWMTKYAEL